MKRLLLIILAAVTLSACYDTHDDDVGYKIVEEFVVRDREWSLGSDSDGLNPYLYHVRTFPALDNHVVRDGIVMGYVERNGLWVPLQNTGWFESQDVNHPWEESIGFGYRKHELVVFFRASDFFYDETLAPMRFRFVLMW